MKFWHYLLLIAAIGLLAFFFFLPNAVAGVTDSRRFDNLVMIDSQSVSFDTAAELSVTERIALAANKKTEILPLNTGNVMNDAAAKDRVIDELKRFFNDRIIKFDFDEYNVEENAAMLVIDATVPTLNMIVWEFVLVDRSENTITVTLDDETGTILRLIFKLGSKNDFITDPGTSSSSEDALFSVAHGLTEMMKDYYGLQITLADYTYRNRMIYYRADLPGRNIVIPMYGAVKATSFTINERV